MDREVIAYQVINGPSADRLTEKVSELLAAGWQPFGAPFYVRYEGVNQALVKYQYIGCGHDHGG